MKRSLSLVLALVMILGSFSTVFAAEPVTTGAEAGAFLNKVGVLVGNEKGDLMLEDNLLRQDTAILVSILMGEQDEAAKFEGTVAYEDIRNNFYLPVLAWAQANETFVGQSATEFGFGKNITAQEYAKVLLTALGYKVAPNGDSDIKWAEALVKATEFGILENVTAVDSTEITRGEMALMTFNALGVVVKGGTKTLAETLNIEMPEAPKAEKLEAKVLDTENLAEIVVELSNADLVENKEALTNPSNYRLNNDVKVENVHLDGDNVVLTLVPYGEVKTLEIPQLLVKGKKFDLTIRNIDTDINKTYKGILAGDNAIPVVENVEFMGTYGIKVTTSEPIANPLERNFRLDSRTSMIVEQYGRDIVLTPYHNVSFDKDAVELTIDQLNDFAGYRSIKSVEEMELSTDDALPTVEAAYRSGNKLTVVFDRDVYHDSIEAYKNRRDTGNVSFVERRVTFTAETAEKVDTNVVVYTFEREIPRGIEVEVKDVANHFNKAMETVVIETVEYKDQYAPVVISSTGSVKITATENTRINDLVAGLTKAKDIDAKLDEKTADVVNRIVDTQAMTITFDKDIAEFVEYQREGTKMTEADLVDHFILYELDVTRRNIVAKEEVTIKVDDVEDDKIKLTFEGIKLNNSTREFDYVLEVRDFADTNRNRMDREYLDFQVVRIDDAFNVVELTFRTHDYFNRDGAEIVLEFNDYVNKEEASNHRNYYLDGKLKVNEAIVEKDGKTVSLVVFDTTVEKLRADYEILEISPRVENLDEDETVGSRFWSLTTRLAITDPAAVEVAVKAAEKAIADLPAIGTLALTDAKAVEAARKLADKAEALDVEVKNIAILEAAEAEIVRLKGIANQDDAAAKLQAAQVAVSKAQITKLKADVDAAQELIDELPAADQVALQANLDIVKNTIAAESVDALIAALPEAGDVELTDEVQIKAARTAYVALTAAQQALVGDEPALAAAELELDVLNQAKADAVDLLIAGLPAAGTVTLADADDIVAARTAYDALTADQVALMSEAVVTIIIAEAELSALQ